MFLFDTARFKYPPHWVDLELLYDSVNTKTGLGTLRGFFLASLKAKQPNLGAGSDGELVRYPKLHPLDFEAEFNQCTSHLAPTSTVEKVLTCFNDSDQIRTTLFCYLFQLNDLYAMTSGGEHLAAHPSFSQLTAQLQSKSKVYEVLRDVIEKYTDAE